jgi:hypothetical protein
MQTVRQMVTTNPNPPVIRRDQLIQCIEVCVLCEQSCAACADACLGEDDANHLRRCIRMNLDCADVCAATHRMLSRHYEPELALLDRQLELCAAACALCAEECRRHDHEHCRICAEMCERTEEECRQALALLRGVGAPIAAAAAGEGALAD